MRTEKEIKERIKEYEKTWEKSCASFTIYAQIAALKWVLTDSEEKKELCRHEIGACNGSCLEDENKISQKIGIIFP